MEATNGVTGTGGLVIHGEGLFFLSFLSHYKQLSWVLLNPQRIGTTIDIPHRRIFLGGGYLNFLLASFARSSRVCLCRAVWSSSGVAICIFVERQRAKAQENMRG